MCSLLDYAALGEHKYLVAESAGGQAVGDVHCGLVSYYFAELRIYLGFRNWVKRGCRLVEDDERRILVKRSRKSYLLCLAAGYSRENFLM